MLLSAPIAHLVCLGGLWVLFRLWSTFRPETSFRRLPNLLLLGVLVNAALVTLALRFRYAEETLAALWFFGTSYAATVLIVLRVWLFFDPRRAFTWCALPAALLYLPPAAWFALQGSPSAEAPAWVLDLWMFPGYFGWTPGILFLLLLWEGCIRGRARRGEGIPLQEAGARDRLPGA